MNTIKRIEIQYFRSIYNVVIKNLSDLNMFTGKNDVGKSNVLKALNLFFNNRIDSKNEFVFEDNFNLMRRQQVKKNSVKGKQFIRIKVTFERGERFEKTLPKTFSVTKKWFRNDFYPSDVKHDLEKRMMAEGLTYNEQRSKMSLTKYLNKIKYFYIPAIKDEAIFGEMLLNLRETIYNNKLSKDRSLVDALEYAAKKVRFATNELSQEFYEVTGVETQIIPPTSVQELYKTLDIITTTTNGNIGIKDRGDGIRVRYIPSILNYISQNSPYINIWGYEEPENSLEYNLSLKMAEDFLIYSIQSQIFLTTHSPAFIGLDTNENVGAYRCYKNKECTYILEMVVAEQQEELAEELGYLKLLNEQYSIYRKRLKELELVKKESEKLQGALKEYQKPILMTEGKTDVDILTMAWKSLYGEECPFQIKSSNVYSEEYSVSAAGCDMLAQTLKSWKYNNANLLIGLFDNDEEGIKAFNLGKNFSLLTQNVKRHRHGNCYAMLLPIIEGKEEFAQAKNLCIEYYFDRESLDKKVNDKGLELEAHPIIEEWCGVELQKKIPDKDTQLYLYKPKKSTKVYFAEEVVPTLSSDKFKGFECLFKQILEIIAEFQSSNTLQECAVGLEE